jgi:DNA ligase 1
MKLAQLVATSQRVAETSGRLEKIGHLAALLGSLSPEEIEIAVAFLSGSYRQRKLNVGYAALQAAAEGRSADEPSLEISEVDTAFERIAGVSAGKGPTPSGSDCCASCSAVRHERNGISSSGW